MGKPPIKISRPILTYGNLVIKLNVRTETENGKFHSEYDFKGNTYLSLSNNVFLTMEIKNKNEEWDPGNGIMINQYNIYQIIKAMKKVAKSFYDNPIFSKRKNGELVLNKDIAVECSEQVNLLTTNGAILIEPSIVYDENDVTYEGVVISINKKGNSSSLPFEVFEGLIYTLEKVDLVQYSQLVMNYFTTYYKEKLTDFYNGKPRAQERKTLDFSKGAQEKTESNFSRVVDDNESILFEGLNRK